MPFISLLPGLLNTSRGLVTHFLCFYLCHVTLQHHPCLHPLFISLYLSSLEEQLADLTLVSLLHHLSLLIKASRDVGEIPTGQLWKSYVSILFCLSCLHLK